MTDSSEFTIADVAKAAGVSVSTVSRILNGKQDVAAATRLRVQQVIEAMDYSPHAQAQRLRAGKTRNLALLFPPHLGAIPFNTLDMEFIAGAAAVAGERQYFFNLLTASITKRALLSLYRSAQADGLVLMQIHLRDWRVDLLRETGYPFVMIGHCDDNTGISFIDLDFEAAMLAAFDYLVELGHRRIGFLGHAETLRRQGYGPAARSWSGYQQAMQNHDLPAIYREADFFGGPVFNATLELLDTSPRITAIVTPHGYLALTILRALDQRKIRVPDDFSLIGVTTNQIAELSTPALTNIDFPSYDMGYRAVNMLIRMLQGTLIEPEQILIPPRLVIRSSTGPARDANDHIVRKELSIE